MTSVLGIESNQASNVKASYNAVKIQVNDARADVSENIANGNNFNAVDIEVNRPNLSVAKEAVYYYPKATKVEPQQFSKFQQVNMPEIPVIPLAYQTNLINNKTFVKADFDFDGLQKGQKVVPEPNIIKLENEKKMSFKAQPDVEIIPPKEIKPEVDVNAIVKNLESTDYDVQAQQMEEIARISMENPKKAVDYLVAEVFDKLINIVTFETLNLAKPSEKQIEIRRQIIINELVKEEALANGEDLDKVELPYKLSKAEMVEAAKLSEIEQAERNKEYALYTTAILAKVYVNEVQNKTGNIVPLTDLPGVSSIVDSLRRSQNPSVKIAAIDALRYIKQDEYSEELNSIFEIVAKDSNPVVADAAKRAL